MITLSNIKVVDSEDPREIKDALQKVYYAPEKSIVNHISETLADFCQKHFSEGTTPLKAFIAYKEKEPIGFVVASLNPYYKSKGKNCGTFGYLSVRDFDTCRELIHAAESFFKETENRKVRGGVNFPKILGGTGILLEGFEHFPMYGVPIGNPHVRIHEFLEKLGYKSDTMYHSVHVYNKIWENAKKIQGNIRFGYLSPKEILERKEEILTIADSVFGPVLPDTSGDQDRIKELLEVYSLVPPAFYSIKEDFDPREFITIPEICEAVETFNAKKETLWAGFAFNSKTEELVGVALSTPNIFQACAGRPITQVNAHTMMVKKGYNGMGIFSGMNAMGQLTFKRYGVDYTEGTTIWEKSERVMSRIVPFTKILRRYAVLQKRVR